MNLEGGSEFRGRGVRRLVGLVVVAAALAGVILLAVLAGPFRASQIAGKDIPTNGVFVDFGLARGALTRTRLVKANFPPGSGNVPTVLNPRLVSDLRNGSGEQFPAAQITLTATAVAAGRVQISATLNPSAPERISGGTYSGTVLLTSGTTNVTVPLVAFLSSREDQLALFAFLLLLFGAVVGLMVKWITEALSQLAAARWRLEDLRRDLGGGSRECLPAQVASKLEEIDRRIMRQDTNGLDTLFQPLISNARHTTAFANAVQIALTEIELQMGLVPTLTGDESEQVDADDIYSVIQAERAEIDTFRTDEWPWSDAVATVTAVKRFAEQTHLATLALQDAARGDNVGRGRASAAVWYFRRGDFEAGVRMYTMPDPPSSKSDEAAAGRRRRRFAMPAVLPPKQVRSSWFAQFGRGSFLQSMMKRPLQFAGLASVIVVATVGLQVQYLDNNGFSGSLGDWLGLALWSAVIELSGVSVLDVLGRLGAGARPSAHATASNMTTGTGTGAGAATGAEAQAGADGAGGVGGLGANGHGVIVPPGMAVPAPGVLPPAGNGAAGGPGVPTGV